MQFFKRDPLVGASAPRTRGGLVWRDADRSRWICRKKTGHRHQVHDCPPATSPASSADSTGTTASVLLPCPHARVGIHKKGKPTTCGGAPLSCAEPEARRAPPFLGGALRAAAESGPHGGTEGGQGARADRQPPSPYELALLPREHLGQAAALVTKGAF